MSRGGKARVAFGLVWRAMGPCHQASIAPTRAGAVRAVGVGPIEGWPQVASFGLIRLWESGPDKRGCARPPRSPSRCLGTAKGDKEQDRR